MANQAPDEQDVPKEEAKVGFTKRKTSETSNLTGPSGPVPMIPKRQRIESRDLEEVRAAEEEKSTGTSTLVHVPHQHSAGTTLLSSDVRSQEQIQAQTAGNLEVANLVQALERNNIPQQQSSLLLSPALATVGTSQLSAALSATNDPRLGTVAILQNNSLTNQLAVNNAIQALVQRESQTQLLNNLILKRQQESALANQALIARLSNNLLTAAQTPNTGQVFAQIVNPLQLAAVPTTLLENLVTPIAAVATAGAPSTSSNAQESAEAVSAAASLPEAEPSRKETLLYLSMDDGHLTEYQVLMRKQIVIDRADEHDIQEDTQGRRVPLTLGQASIQCRHCKHKPFRQRGKGSVYYPTSLDRLYQTCQNMSNIHLRKTCTCIDQETRQQLNVLCSIRGRATEGKQYWADGGKALGLHESRGALYWRSDEKDRP